MTALKKNGRLLLVWLLLALLSGLVAWQLYGFLLTAGWAISQSERGNVYGWNSYTIGLISKMGVLVAGIFWIFSLSLFENRVRHWERIEQLKEMFIKTAGALVATAVFLFLLGVLISR